MERVGGIVIANGGIALMHRKNVTRPGQLISDYYTFPGGGRELGESREECLLRELNEELGINVKIIRFFEEDYFELKGTYEYYYLCEYIDGNFGTGDGPEFQYDEKFKDSGDYIPEVVKISDISNLTLLPEKIKNKLIQEYNEGKIKI